MPDKDLKFAGYNLLVTSEIEMTDQDIYNTYHKIVWIYLHSIMFSLSGRDFDW